jgi:hypothetical protein
MKERPILYSAPMVRGILDDRKTITRRIAKLNASGRVTRAGKQWHPDDPDAVLACPYGQPGDRLWVRETWQVARHEPCLPHERDYQELHSPVIRYIAEAVRATPTAAASPPPAWHKAQRLIQQLADIALPKPMACGNVTLDAKAIALLRQPSREIFATPPAGVVPGLRAGAVRILQQLSARAPAGYSKPQVGALTKFSHKGGTFNTYLSDLRRAGYIEERDGLLFASDAGIQSLCDKLPAKPTTHDEVMAMWRTALRAGAFAMLEAIVAAGAAGMDRRSLADAVGMSAAGGTFNTYLSDLRRNGLITEARGGACVANDILFPEK